MPRQFQALQQLSRTHPCPRALTVHAAATSRGRTPPLCQLSTPRQCSCSTTTHAPLLQPAAAAAGRQQRCLTAAAAAAGSGCGGAGSSKGGAGAGGSSSREDEIWQQLSQMADKYLFAAGPSRRYSSSSNSPLPFQAIHALLCCFLAVWLLTNTPLLGSSCSGLLKLLSLDQISSSSSSWLVRLLCPLTDAVSSSSNALLARNLFFGYMFGRVVENTGGSGALWLTYVLSAVGGACSCALLLPRRAPLQGCAATAALFGLFCAATLFNRHKHWHWQRLFELAVLLPFTLQQLLWGHQGLTQWTSLMGFRLPGAWVPLLGGVLGAAVAAGVLVVVRALQEAVAAQQRQQQQRGRQVGSRDGGGGGEGEVPMSVLLARAAAALLRKRLGS